MWLQFVTPWALKVWSNAIGGEILRDMAVMWLRCRTLQQWPTWDLRCAPSTGYTRCAALRCQVIRVFAEATLANWQSEAYGKSSFSSFKHQ